MRHIYLSIILTFFQLSLHADFGVAVFQFSENMTSECHHGQSHIASNLVKVTSQQIQQKKPSKEELQKFKEALVRAQESIQKKIPTFNKANVIENVCRRNYMNYKKIADQFISYIEDLQSWEVGTKKINRMRFKQVTRKLRKPASLRLSKRKRNYYRKKIKRAKRQLNRYQRKSNLPLTPVEMYQLMR